jgi:biotin carboxylase
MNTERRPPKTRLLVMSVGSLVGNAILECVDMVGRDRFEIIGMNSEASAANNFRCDACYLAPAVVNRELLFALLDRLHEQYKFDLIIPGRDDDVVALAAWEQTRLSQRTMVGSPVIAEIIRDKWKSYDWARENGLPFARSAIDDVGLKHLRQTCGLPLVAKPRLGFGSNGVRLLLTDEHVEHAFAHDDVIVQEAISPSPTMSTETLSDGVPLWFAPVQPGSPLAISLLDGNGARFVSITYSRHVRGAAIDNVLLDAPDLRETLMRFSEVAWRAGWRGLFSIQARPNAAGQHIPIELAGRFMGATSALSALGVNVFEQVLSTFIPTYEIVSLPKPDFELRVVKQVRTHAHRLSDETRLKSDRVWFKR